MKLTTRAIAAAAGVSPATVSRCISGNGEVSQELTRRIDEAIAELGGGTTIRRKKSKIILVLLTHLRFAFYSQALRELLEQEREGKYTLVLMRYDPENPDAIKSFVSRMHPVGTLYFEEEIDEAILKYLHSAGIRTVMCGGVAVDHDSDMVHVNDIMAAYEGTRYLLGLGHRKILFLSDDIQKIGAGFQRITGCRKAMEEAGLTLADDMVNCGPVTFEEGYAAAKRAISDKRKFTALFAFSDELAIGAMAALYDEGVRVPEDVSVLGFDDLPMASRVRPALTSIHQPISVFVRKARELFDEPKQDLSAELLLQYSIVERESCRRL